MPQIATMRHPRLGATPIDDGTTKFCVWAPRAAEVAVHAGATRLTLEPAGQGIFEGSGPVASGADHELLLDGDVCPDPMSGRQPAGLEGPSHVVDLSQLPLCSGWTRLALKDAVVYEMHVGTFSPRGTFDGAVPRLTDLQDLGVTAIEVMPIATFAGDHGWGCDGVYIYAPHSAYGGFQGFARLADAAHEARLAVISTSSTTIWERARTRSQRLALTSTLPRRRCGVEPSAMASPRSASGRYRTPRCGCATITSTVFGSAPCTPSSTSRGHTSWPRSPSGCGPSIRARSSFRRWRSTTCGPSGQWGHDAQWGDALHHEAHVLLAGEQEGNYADYGSVEGLARELPCPERERLVVCAQNHDQVGNWAMGESTLRCYRELLALRREPADTPVEVDPDSGARMLRFRRGGVELVANFDDQAHDGVPPRTGVVRR